MNYPKFGRVRTDKGHLSPRNPFFHVYDRIIFLYRVCMCLNLQRKFLYSTLEIYETANIRLRNQKKEKEAFIHKTKLVRGYKFVGEISPGKAVCPDDDTESYL